MHSLEAITITRTLKGSGMDDEHLKQATYDGVSAALEGLSSTPELQQLAEELRNRTAESICPAELTTFLQRIINAARDQQTRLEREKEQLLAQMGAGLDEISAFLGGERAERTATAAESDTLNVVLTGEVEQLRLSFAKAAKPAELRTHVNVRLAAINAHLHKFRENQEARARAFEERANRLNARVQELEHDLKEKRRLALLDSLTGIANRTAYDERVEAEFTRLKRTNEPLSLLVWDIDRFKAINDAFGHKAGDKVLHVLAQLFAKRIRSCDFVARYGGEEFVMLLSGACAKQAHEIADKLRAEIAKLRFLFRQTRVEVTASCGIATVLPGETPSKVFERADRALYRAKSTGRNRCVLSSMQTDAALRKAIA